MAMIHLRGPSLALPRITGAIDLPSRVSPSGSFAPASSAKVGRRSVKSLRASVVTPWGTRPGQLAMKGSQEPFSRVFPFAPRTRRPLRMLELPPVPLSVVQMTMVFSRRPVSSSFLMICPMRWSMYSTMAGNCSAFEALGLWGVVVSGPWVRIMG